jgi:hypothetical protein
MQRWRSRRDRFASVRARACAFCARTRSVKVSGETRKPRRAGRRREASLLCAPWPPHGPVARCHLLLARPTSARGAPSSSGASCAHGRTRGGRQTHAPDLVHVAQQLPAVFKALGLTSEFLSIKVDCADRGFGDRGMAALCEALVAIRRPRMQARLLFYKLHLTDASMPHVRLPPPRCLPDWRSDHVLAWGACLCVSYSCTQQCAHLFSAWLIGVRVLADSQSFATLRGHGVRVAFVSQRHHKRGGQKTLGQGGDPALSDTSAGAAAQAALAALRAVQSQFASRSSSLDVHGGQAAHEAAARLPTLAGATPRFARAGSRRI